MDDDGPELEHEVQLNKLHLIVIMTTIPTVYLFGTIFKFFSFVWIFGLLSLLLSPNRVSLTARRLTIYNSPKRFFRRDRVDLEAIVKVEPRDIAFSDIMRDLTNMRRRYLFYNGRKGFVMSHRDGRELVVSSKQRDEWVKRLNSRINCGAIKGKS